MARMSGDEGVWPMGPAANPAKPAPSASRPSMAETGTILAQGLPCMSTNMAKRNSTPSRSRRRRQLRRVRDRGASRSSVLVSAIASRCRVRRCRGLPVNDVAPWETGNGY